MAGSVGSRASSDCASLTPVKVRIIDGKKGDFDAHLYVGVDVYWVKASSGNRAINLDSFVTLHREILPTRRARRGYIQLERGEVVVEEQVAGSKRGALVTRRQIKITSDKQNISVKFECDDKVASWLLPYLKSRVRLWATLTDPSRSPGDNLQSELAYISDSFMKGLQGVERAEATPREQYSSKIIEDTPFLLRIAKRVCKDVGSLWIPLEKFGKELHHLREPARALTVLPLVGVGFGLIASGLDLCAKVSQDRLDWNQAWKDAILFFETLLDVFCRTLSCEEAILQRSLDKVAALCEKVEGELRILEKFRFQSTLHKFRNKFLDRDSPSKARDKLKELQQDMQLIFVDRIDQITSETNKDVRALSGKIDGQTQVTGKILSYAHNAYECRDPTCEHQDCKDENLERVNKKVRVPMLPKHARLDFENPERPEKKLKDTLLTEDCPIVALQGMGGVGKTTCLISVAGDSGIASSFADGILWIQLSKDSGPQKLEEAFRNIILFAWHQWGYVVPKSALKPQADLKLLKERAKDALDGKRCLLIFDDVWYSEKSTPPTLAHEIASLVNDLTPPTTKIVFSTRFKELSPRAEAINVGDLDSETASSLFDAWAEGEPKEKENLALKKGILRLCANFALALCIAGANVRRIGCKRVLKTLEGNLANLRGLPHTGPERKLNAVMMSSLDCVEDEGHRKGYQYLAAFANKSVIPSTALEALWDDDEANVEDRVDLYIEMSLARRKTVSAGKLCSYYVEFHDRHLEYARYCCRKHKYDLEEGISLRDTHARLVEGYRKRSVGEADVWWKAKILDDRYFYENYVHHLLESEAVEDVVELLLDFRWIKLRYERLQMPDLLRDYDETIERSKRHGKEATTDNNLRVEALRLVSRSLRTALSRLWEHKDELAFQLVGRLRYIRDENTSVERLLDQIERLETGQLLYTVNQCFETRTSASQHIFDIDEGVTCLAVMRNEGGWHIVAGTWAGQIYIYNGNDMQKSKTLTGHKRSVKCLAVTSNSNLLISGSNDNTLRTWSRSTGKCLKVLRGHEGPVRSVAFGRDERFAVSGSKDCSVRLWNVATGECLRILSVHSGEVMTVSLMANDNRIVFGSENGELFVWNLASKECERKLEKDDDDIGSGIWSMAVSDSEDDAFIVTGHSDGTVRIWSIADGRRKYALKGHKGRVRSVAVTPNRQRVVSASMEDTMRVWDVATGENLKVFHYFNPPFLKCMALIDDNRAVTCSVVEHIRLWDLESLDCDERNYDDDLRPSFTCSNVSKSGRCIVSGFYDGSVSVQNVDSGEILQRVSGHKGIVRSVEFIGDGNLVVSSGYHDNTALVWNMTAEAYERVFQSEGEDVVEVVVAGDQSRIAMAFTNTILIWDVCSKDCSKVCSAPQEKRIESIAVTDCGDEVVSMSRDWIRLWKVRDGIWSCRIELQGPGERWSSVGITGDGAHVVSASSDNTTRIWNSASGKCEKALDKHGRDVIKLAVTRGGSHVVFLSSYHDIYVWNVADGICRRVNQGWDYFFFAWAPNYSDLVRHAIFSDLLSECDDERILDISKRASAATIKVDDKTLTVSPHDAGGKVMSATFDSKILNVLVVDFKRGSGRIVLVAGRRLYILKVPDLPSSY